MNIMDILDWNIINISLKNKIIIMNFKKNLGNKET